MRLKELPIDLNLLASTAARIFAAAGRPTIPKLPDARLPQIIADRLAHKSLGQIGESLGGISRERVRQILAAADLDPETRERVTGYIKPKAVNPARVIVRGRGGRFVMLVNRWLAEIGYRYCNVDHHAQPLSEFSPKSFDRCRPCNTRLVRKYSASPKVQAYKKAYSAAHPEVQARAAKKYYDKQKLLKVKGETIPDVLP